MEQQAASETQRREAYLKALLEDRRQCAARGLWDRVAHIDELLGGAVAKAETPAKRAEKRPNTQRGQTR